MSKSIELVETKKEPVAQELAQLNSMDGVSPLVQMLASGQVPLEQMEKMMDLQDRYEAKEALKAYNAAMSEFRKNCPAITKDSLVDFKTAKGRTTYQHASLDGVMNTIKGLLGELGLNPTWDIDDTTEAPNIRVTCIITHRDGHSESTSLAGPPDQSGNKNILQQRASTVTYLQRYTLFSVLGLSAGIDTDGGGPPAPAAPKEDTTANLEQLKKQAKASGIDDTKLISVAAKTYSVSTLEELSGTQISELITALKQRAK